MRRADFFCLLFFGGFGVLLFYPILFSPQGIPGNFGDLYGYHYPLKHLVSSRLQEGKLPLWNPYIFGGTPLLGNPQSAIFYPLSLLFYFFPIGSAFGWYSFLHVCLAGLGMYLLLKSQSLARSGALLLAVAYAFSPFLIYRIAQGVPTLLAALSYIPWCWLAFLSQRKGFLAFVFALQFLSGHAQFLWINILGLLLGVVLCAGWRRWSGFLWEGVLGLALVAFQLGPTWEFSQRSIRTLWSGTFSQSYSMNWSSWLSFLNPHLLGNPLGPLSVPEPSVYFESWTGYIGLIPLGLGVWGLLGTGWKSARLPWALLGLSLFLSMGQHNPLSSWLLTATPLSLLRAPARCVLLGMWGLLLAAGVGWKALKWKGHELWRWKAAAISLVFLDLFWYGHSFLYAQDPQRYLAPHENVISLFSGQPYRVATSPEIPNPNKCMLYRFWNAAGYEAFYLASFAEYLARSEGQPSADSSRVYIRKYDSGEMSDMSVRYFMDVAPLPGKKIYYQEGSTHIYENPMAKPLVYFPRGRGDVHIERASPEWWAIHVGRPLSGEEEVRKIVFAQPLYPGWQGWMNGARRPLSLYRNFLQEMSIEGPGEIYLRFWPSHWNVLLLFSLGAWGGWMVFFRRGRIL
ncbi:MAG: hypothetical protein HY399_03855 [Elusimicrobia bacterium]|nr:hypothetical protein [Elusimicrobiota bacterium]